MPMLSLLKNTYDTAEKWYDRITGRKKTVLISIPLSPPQLSLKDKLEKARMTAIAAAPRFKRFGEKRKLTFQLAVARGLEPARR